MISPFKSPWVYPPKMRSFDEVISKSLSWSIPSVPINFVHLSVVGKGTGRGGGSIGGGSISKISTSKLLDASVYPPYPSVNW